MAQASPGRRTPGEETAPSELGSPGRLLGQIWGRGCWQPRKRGPGDVSLGGKQGGNLCLSWLVPSAPHPWPCVWVQRWEASWKRPARVTMRVPSSLTDGLGARGVTVLQPGDGAPPTAPLTWTGGRPVARLPF